MKRHLCHTKQARRTFGAVTATLLVALSAIGQTPATQSDYSDGFAKFYKLGLPDVSKAKYVKLDVYDYSGGADYHDYAGQLYEMKLSGNAWMLSEEKDGKSVFVLNNCRTIEVYDEKALRKEREKKMLEEQKKQKAGNDTPVIEFPDWAEDGKTGGKWKAADLKSDIDKTINYMKKKMTKEQNYDPFEYSSSYGTLFLSAIHYHSQGYTNEANQIVGMLFEASKDRRKVIMQSLGIIADTGYSEIINKFFKDRDWNSLSSNLTTLLKKFSVGWKNGLAVKQLTLNITKHIQKTEPAKLSSDELTLSEEDQALAAELAKAEDYKMSGNRHAMHPGLYYGQAWILNTPAKDQKQEKIHVIDKIRNRGMQSIPLLLAMLKDDCFINMDIQKITGRYNSVSYSSGTEMTDEEVTRIYNSMRRPATRADVAMFLLSPLPAREESRRYRSSQDPNELYDEVKLWYEANKDKSTMDIARDYMKNGDSEQQRSGLQYIMKNGEEADMNDIEKHLLDSLSNMQRGYWSGSSSVHQYVQVRGDKAKAFVEKYEARIKELIADSNNEMFKDANIKKNLERELAALKKIISTKPVSEILAEVVEGKTNWNDASALLHRQLGKEKKNTAMEMILDSALKVKDAKISADLLRFTANITYLGNYDLYGMPMQNTNEKDELDIKLHVEKWQKLLADKRVIPNPYGAGQEKTVAETAAWALERAYSRDGSNQAAEIPYALGDKLTEIVLKRAHARLEGKTGDDLPRFPAADNLTEDQKKALITKITSTPTEKLPGVIAGLSSDEELVFLEDFPEDDEAFKKNAIPAAYKVTVVKGSAVTAGIMEKCNALKDKRLDRKMVEDLIETAKECVKNGNIINCSLIRKYGLKGVEILISERAPKNTDSEVLINIDYTLNELMPNKPYRAEARVTASVSGDMFSGSTTWKMESEKAGDAKKPEAEKTTGEDALFADALEELNNEMNVYEQEAREQFWEAVDKLIAGEGSLNRQSMISITGNPVMKKPEKGNSND